MSLTQDEIISMMKEAGFYFGKDDVFIPEWGRFASLVAAHERERAWTEKDWGEAAEWIRQQEREACSKLCDDKHDYMCSRAAAAIRARSEK